MEIYDLSTNTWNQNIPSLHIARSNLKAYVISADKIIIVGGKNQNSSQILTAEIYNPITNTITQSSQMPYAIYNGKSALIDSQFVYYIGQHDSNVNKILKYDITNNSWSEVYDLNTADQVLAVEPIDNQSFRIIFNTVQSHRSIITINCNSNTITNTTIISNVKYQPSVVQISDGRFFTVGGSYGTWELH